MGLGGVSRTHSGTAVYWVLLWCSGGGGTKQQRNTIVHALQHQSQNDKVHEESDPHVRFVETEHIFDSPGAER